MTMENTTVVASLPLLFFGGDMSILYGQQVIKMEEWCAVSRSTILIVLGCSFVLFQKQQCASKVHRRVVACTNQLGMRVCVNKILETKLNTPYKDQDKNTQEILDFIVKIFSLSSNETS